MLRRFRRHDLRRVEDLTGPWDFAFLGDADAGSVDPRALAFDDVMPVPGSFDATPRYAGRRGLAAYRLRAPVADSTPHRLVLDGVHHWCRVFAGGRHIGDHSGGFTRFSFDFEPAMPGECEIVVLADNRFDAGRSPLHLPYYDWYHFGGMTRAAELHRLGEAWVDDLRIVTLDHEARRLRLTLRLRSREAAGALPLSVSFDGRELVSETVEVGRGAAVELVRELEVPGAALWSPSSPSLHDLHVTFAGDDERERVGIRTVRAEGRRLLLNGEPVTLLGFCRHESHPEFGCGLPWQVLASDVQQLLDMGANFVRGSHYPQDVRFLDLCDEKGLCVWSEGTGWGNSEEHLADERFVRAALVNAGEMVAQSFNRPSVIMWGVLNECHTERPECRPAMERLVTRIRELDPSRPVTYACNHPMDDLCMDLADVMSLNMYPGWYGSDIDSIPEAIDRALARLDAAGQGDRPFVMSEIGAGALYGWRDWNGQRWTEQYQARLLDRVIRHLFMERDRAVGISIWQYCDVRTGEDAKPGIGRPRCFNNKGVVDEYRRPKLAYETVRRLFTDVAAAKAARGVR